jgi:integrase
MLKFSLVPEVTMLKIVNLVDEFNHYLAAKSLNLHNLPSYYLQTKKLLQKWGNTNLDLVPTLLGTEKYSPKTFNDRRNCLSPFFDYLVRKKKISDNPLAEVVNKIVYTHRDKRAPFTHDEVARLLDALNTDRYRSKCSRYSHKQYYPMVAFMIQTGVRNGEAIALQVRDIIWDQSDIKICRSMARTAKGTHMAARKEKGTKNSNVRFIPMNAFLIQLLTPLIKDKHPTELVFTNENGNMIDDNAFQKRVFKPLLKKLKITDRDLYACRHTFATRAVQSGMKPHEVAYLMGDRLDTIVKNYYHGERIQTSLPEMVKLIV